MVDNPTMEAEAVSSGQAPRRLMIVVGAAIMAGIMLVAAFSLGVWVGSGRADNPALFGGPGPQAARPAQGPTAQQGPGQGPAAGQARPTGPGQTPALGTIARAPDLVGRIQAFSGNNLTIEAPGGPRIVRLAPDTEVILPDGSKGQVENLTRGSMVAVVGVTGDDGRSFRAEAIAILPGRP